MSSIHIVFTGILWVLSRGPLQSIILWICSVPRMPKHFANSVQLVSIFTSLLQKENWSLNKATDSPRGFTAWVWDVAENRNEDTESYSEPWKRGCDILFFLKLPSIGISSVPLLHIHGSNRVSISVWVEFIENHHERLTATFWVSYCNSLLFVTWNVPEHL